jgi:hypothetical protein
MALIRTGSTTWEDNVDPTVTSDSSAGYQTGDYHRNTATGDVFYIKDTTVGAAVWVDADPSAGGGGGGATLRNVSATDTFATANETINCTANTFIVNLPTAIGIQGTPYTLVNSGTGTITLKGNIGQTINGSTTIDLAQYTSRTVQSDGTNWIII